MTVATEAMRVHVYDTHVTTLDDKYYHFDVLVSDDTVRRATEFAEEYLRKLGVVDAQVNQKVCNFCHSEMANPTVQDEILDKGYYIIPMQGCPKG